VDIKKFKAAIIKLIKLNSTPNGIALGVAIGAFIAITPTYGFHTLLVIIAAILIPRVNKIAILLGTNVSLPPTLPFITWAGYEIGRAVLHKNYPALNSSYFNHFTLHSIRDLYYPLFVGSVILGIACAVILYLITFSIAYNLRKRKQECHPQKPV